MEAKSDQIDQLLRYSLAGGMGVATFVVAAVPAAAIVDWKPGAGDVALGLGLVTLLGATIYAVHRAFLYPPILRLLYITIRQRSESNAPSLLRFWNPWVLDKHDIDQNYLRWNRVRDAPEVQTALARWSSHVHFLYSSAWATAGSLIISMGMSPGGFVPRHWLWVWAGLLLGCALVDDYRVTSMELDCCSRGRTSTLTEQANTPLQPTNGGQVGVK